MKRNKLMLLVVALLAMAMIFTACTSPATTDPTEAPTVTDGPKPTDSEATEAPDTGGSTVDDPNFNPTGWPVVKEQETLKIFGSRATETPEDVHDIYIIQKIMDQTNVDFQWQQETSTTFTEKKNVMLASGQYPDVISWNATTLELVRYGSEGVFIPLQDLIAEFTPNCVELYEERPDLKAFWTAPDGNIYCYPYLNEGGWMQSGDMLIINTDWLEAIGKDMPTTIDEFTEVLRLFKTEDPNGNGIADEIPLAFRTSLTGFANKDGGAGLDYIIGSFGTVATNSFLDATDDGKVEYVATREEWKNAVKYFRDLYAEGLIDSAAITMDSGTWTSTFNKTPFTFGCFPIWEIGDGFTEGNGGPEAYDFVAPLYNGDKAPVYYVNDMPGALRGAWVITKSCAKPYVAARVADAFLDKDTSLTMMEGPIDGPAIRLVPCTVCNNGRALMVSNETPDGMTTLQYRNQNCITGTTTWAVTRAYYDERLHLHFTDRKVEHIDKVMKPLKDNNNVPDLYYTLQEAEVVNQIQNDIRDYANTTALEWVMGQGDIDADWDAYLAELDRLRLPELLTNAQAAYTRFEEAK